MRGTRRLAMTRRSSMFVILERSGTGRGSLVVCSLRGAYYPQALPPTTSHTKEVISMSWLQVYDPFGSMVVSTALAAIPVVVMLVCLGFLHMKAHLAAGLGLLSALLIAIVAFGMPAGLAGRAAFLGGLTGVLPIGWIVLNIIFL